MTLAQRRRLQRHQIGRAALQWLVMFTSITAALLVSATVVGIGLRAYWLWSVAETQKEIAATNHRLEQINK